MSGDLQAGTEPCKFRADPSYQWRLSAVIPGGS